MVVDVMDPESTASLVTIDKYTTTKASLSVGDEELPFAHRTGSAMINF
jgi:hypothetical protein